MDPPDRLLTAAELRDRARRLIDVGTTLLSELDLESVLRSVVEAARELTGAEYAALGVLDRSGEELERFIYLGIDDETKRAIGNLPRGRGVLGELIRQPEPLRLADVNQHPHAYGFPPGHPPMNSFLGVPIRIRDEVYGNLYMTEKRGAAEFDDADEQAARTLATWAGIAIENARLYTRLSEREAEVEQALRRAETSVDIARAVGGETNVERVLDLIVKRARALVEAKTLLVLLRKGGRLVVAAQAGQVGAGGRAADDPDRRRGLPRRRCRSGSPSTSSAARRPRRRGCASGSAPRRRWSCRCSSAAAPSAPWSPSIAKPAAANSTRRTCASCRPSRPAPRPRWRPPRRSSPTACSSRSRSASASASAGRASCTTRPCRAWPRSASRWRRRCRATPPTGPRRSPPRRCRRSIASRARSTSSAA